MKKFIFLVVVAGGLYLGARLSLVWSRPASDLDSRAAVTVEKGSNLKTISQKLRNAGVIRDSWAFRLFAKWNDLDTQLQAGEYVIPRNLTMKEVAEILQHARGQEVKITIPEGSTIRQIDEILTRKTLSDTGEFTNCAATCDLGFRIGSLEGWLFPSTYYVNPETFSNKKFIQRLYRELKKQSHLMQQEIDASGRDLEEIVIVASMVEREAANAAEMKEVAGVIWARLDEGTVLGIDATTRYALDNWNRPLRTEDFVTSGPYNTRSNRGLPPTAVGNPGLDALRAAITPTQTQNRYYLHDRKGQIHFSKTYKEHLQKKAKYLD